MGSRDKLLGTVLLFGGVAVFLAQLAKRPPSLVRTASALVRKYASQEEYAGWADAVQQHVQAGRPVTRAALVALASIHLEPSTVDRIRSELRGRGLIQGDEMPGGRADNMSPADFDPDDLAAGTAHEMEHTNRPIHAREIAMDHLAEDPDYYRKLAKLGSA